MNKINALKRSLWFLVAAAPLAPLMVAASCGSNSTSEPVVYADVIALPDDKAVFDEIKASATSDHTNVMWTSADFSLSSKLSSVTFLQGNFATLEAVQGAPSEAWTTTLPATTSFDRLTRHLWIRVIPAANVVVTNPFYDLTVSSEIQVVKSLVDADSSFAALNLKQVLLSGDRIQPIVDESALTLPPFLKLAYEYKTLSGLTSQTLVSEMVKDTATMTMALAQSIKVSLALVEGASQYYLLNNSKATTITTDGNGNASKAFVLETAVIVDPTSFLATVATQDRDRPWLSGLVSWKTGFNDGEVPVLPTGIKSIEFVLGDYPTQAAAEADYAAKKTTALPMTVGFDYTKRFLWAFLKPSSGYKLKDGKEVFNITTSSKVQAINYSLRDDATYLDFFNNAETKLVIRGTISNPNLDLSALSIPSKLSYKFSTRTNKIDLNDPVTYNTALEAVNWAISQGYATAEAINNAVANKEIFFYLFFKSNDSHYYVGYNATEGFSTSLQVNLI